MQRDASECILQLALFPAGANALKSDKALREAVTALVDKGFTAEIKDCARRVVMVFDEDRASTRIEIDEDSKHIMMSYQWGCQVRS